MSGYIRHRSGLLVPNPGRGFVNNGKGNGRGSGSGGGVVIDPNAASLYSAFLGTGAWWDFEESGASTLRYDDATGNANHLTTNAFASSNTTASGKVGRAFAPLSDNYAFIPRSNTALDLPNTDWTFGGWYRGTGTAGSTSYLMGRADLSTNKGQGILAISSGNGAYLFECSSDGTNYTVANSGVNAVTGTIYLIACTFDRANNLIRIRVKGPATNVNITAAFASALFTGASTANFTVNQLLVNDITLASGARGVINSPIYDSNFFIKKAITDAELTYLYNNGNGVNYTTLRTQAGY